VPSLKLPDDSIMTESAAMMIHLADSHPGSGPRARCGLTAARAQYLRWLIYLAAAAYATDLRLYYPDRYSTDAAHADCHQGQGLRRPCCATSTCWPRGWARRPVHPGRQTMSAADIYAAMLIAWSDDMPALCVRHPKLQALYDAVTALPTLRKIWDRNGMP
jgi:GST-like protein